MIPRTAGLHQCTAKWPDCDFKMVKLTDQMDSHSKGKTLMITVAVHGLATLPLNGSCALAAWPSDT